MNQAYLLLGSNIDKEHNLPAGLQLLRTQCQVLAVSPVYETAPVGLHEQPNFFNVAVLVETELDPAGLKTQVLAHIERQLKRVRTSNKNAPRTIDLDIILFRSAEAGAPNYPPDPDLQKFPHVAVPLADLAPNLPHPQTGEPLRVLADHLLAAATAQNHGQPPLWPRPDMDQRLANPHR